VIAWLSYQCKNPENSTTCRSVREIHSHNNPTLKSTVTPGMILPNPKSLYNVQFSEFYSFELKIEKILLNEFTHISVACSSERVFENETTTFPRHGQVLTRSLNLADPNVTYICDISLANPITLSDKYIGFWFSELSLNLFLFIVIVFCRDLQPLKSRGLVPYVSVLAQYGSILISFQYHLQDLEFRSKYSCVFNAFMYYNLLSVTFFLMPLNYLRYVLLVNINKNKEYLSSNSKGFYFKLISVLTKITTPGFTILMIFLFLLFFGIVDLCIIGIANESFVCKEYISQTLTIFHFSVNIVFIICLFSIGIIDIVINIVSFFRNVFKKKSKGFFKMIGPSFYDFYFFSDPFYFRIEQIFSGILFLFYIVTEILSLDKIFGNKSVEYIYYVKITISITRTIVRYLFLIYQVIIPLLLSIFVYFKNLIKKCFRNKGEVTLNELQIVMNNEALFLLFCEFSQKEWSYENILCFQDIEGFRKESKLEKKKEIAFEIFSKYLNASDSPLEINIDQRQCKILFKEMQSDSDVFNDELFVSVEQALQVNLADTLGRFIISDEYLNYERNSYFVDKELHQKKSILNFNKKF
jgi:hypothetical protein